LFSEWVNHIQLCFQSPHQRAKEEFRMNRTAPALDVFIFYVALFLHYLAACSEECIAEEREEEGAHETSHHSMSGETYRDREPHSNIIVEVILLLQESSFEASTRSSCGL